MNVWINEVLLLLILLFVIEQIELINRLYVAVRCWQVAADCLDKTHFHILCNNTIHAAAAAAVIFAELNCMYYYYFEYKHSLADIVLIMYTSIYMNISVCAILVVHNPLTNMNEMSIYTTYKVCVLEDCANHNHFILAIIIIIIILIEIAIHEWVTWPIVEKLINTSCVSWLK